MRPIYVQDCLGLHQRRSLARVGTVSMANQVATMGIRFLSSIILSRLLPPETFGLLAMVMFFQAFLSMLNGSGFVEAAVQQEHLNLDQLNGVFWLNTALSLCLSLLLIVGGPFIAYFYNEPELTSICLVLGLLFFFENIFITHSVLLRRTMKSELSMVIFLPPQMVGLVVSVVMAVLGFEVWALIGGMVFGALARRAFLMYFVRWEPGRFVRGVGLRKMLNYGFKTTAAQSVAFLTRNLQTLAMGKFATPTDVGYFNRGQSLFQIPMEQVAWPVSNLIFPALASVQNDRAKVVDLVLRATWLVALILMPIAAVMIAYGDWILVWLIGEQWQPAGEVVRWMAFSAIPALLFVALPKANAAIGRPGRGMPVQLASLPVLVAGVFLTAPEGAIAVARFFAIYRWVLFPFMVFVLLKGSGFNLGRVLRSMGRMMLLIGVLVFAIAVFRSWVSGYDFWGRLLAVALLAGFSVIYYCLVYRLFKEGRDVLRWLYEHFFKRLKLPARLFAA